ncbi:hypothetical protein Tco_0801813 [Tanacetum coccineum]|uniref:Uncharacterized protein n=1 Tax=Tanacetum coccineum TaxID=301880 RepID=A0ABQ4ZX16_9ASTR
MLQIFSQRLLMLAEVGEGSGQPTNPQHTSTSAQLSNEEPITVLSLSQLKKTHKPRIAKRTTEISQSSGPIHLVADEIVYKEWEDRMERAATTASSLEAEQDSGNINRTQSMETLNEHLPQGTGLSSGPRFALSENPTIYDSHIKQFWQTATVNTFDNGKQEITATVDGHVKTVTIAPVRKYLQLADAGGLSSLPNTDIFKQLLLMGYAITSDKLTFQKGHFPLSGSS